MWFGGYHHFNRKPPYLLHSKGHIQLSSLTLKLLCVSTKQSWWSGVKSQNHAFFWLVTNAWFSFEHHLWLDWDIMFLGHRLFFLPPQKKKHVDPPNLHGQSPFSPDKTILRRNSRMLWKLQGPWPPTNIQDWTSWSSCVMTMARGVIPKPPIKNSNSRLRGLQVG